MSSTTFSSLPIEVVYPIFALACAPDRASGSCPVGPRLNLVSKAFHDICLTFGPDLEHVAVRGLLNMITFVGFLSQRNMYAKRVRCLFFEASSLRRTNFAGFITRYISEILGEIDPSYLRVLFISLSDTQEGSTIPIIELPCTFPALSHVFLSEVILLSPSDCPSLAPNLKDMQILGLAADTPPKLNLAAELTLLAPSLRRLKFSVLPSPYSAALLIPAVKKLVVPRSSGTDKTQTDTPHTPPQVTLAFDYFYVPASPNFSRMSPVAEADPVGTYRAGIALFGSLRRIPKDPVVILPAPEIRDAKLLLDDAKRRRETLWSDWVACVAGREVVWREDEASG